MTGNPTLDLLQQCYDKFFHVEIAHSPFELVCRECYARDASGNGAADMKHEPGCLYAQIRLHLKAWERVPA